MSAAVAAADSRCISSECRCIRQQHRQLTAATLASALLLTACLATSISLLALQSSPDLQEPTEAPPSPVSPLSESEDDVGRQLLDSKPGHLLLTADWADALSNVARFHPSPFLSENPVLNSTVYCDSPSGSQLSMFYSEPTWICKNARVGNRRLPFTDTTTRNQDDLVLLRKLELDLPGPELPNEMCGRLPERGNNVFLLCELLLASLLDGAENVAALHRIRSSSVHVPFGNCSLPEHGRAILVGSSKNTAAWHREDRLWPGFIVDIFCSFSLPKG